MARFRAIAIARDELDEAKSVQALIPGLKLCCLTNASIDVHIDMDSLV
jgi:hypothetical protein